VVAGVLHFRLKVMEHGGGGGRCGITARAPPMIEVDGDEDAKLAGGVWIPG
jgi:hypothetical protein